MKLFSCNICQRQFKAKWNLTRHKKRVHEKVTPRNFNCAFCSKDFVTYQELERHILSHVSEKPYNCNKCSSTFARQGSLQDHMKKIHFNVQGCIPCEICGKMFHTRINMMNHLIVHTGERPYKCNICGAGFARKHTLKIHLLIHGKLSEEKAYKCCLRDKMFSRKDYVTMHMKTHLNERPHKCGFCGKDFVTLSNMKRHLTVHNVGNHICVICNKRFSSYWLLEDHVSSHTKEKPYFCHVCHKAFSHKRSLPAHLRKVHKS